MSNQIEELNIKKYYEEKMNKLDERIKKLEVIHFIYKLN